MSKRRKIEKIKLGLCGECVEFIPYNDNFLDPQGVPIMGDCPHRGCKILRGERGCDYFLSVITCKK